ncbi:hypothetical protein ACFSFZ_18000 [Mixta tenebrionis]|mgnify:CR=1 FL=1|uniref:Uncharacterized protein n=1 Tax=Mixta tenebrionis TaxID=2562439 RepID=A0A506VD59_9GAMM|nr:MULTISPECIES: hypothetical protein [Mixta]QHM76638.1 hypothetical protein C7M52_02621 [Mixta theicola]TPW43941.1 hypothetical protein FKM52_05225 [Mixta tenebrionis]
MFLLNEEQQAQVSGGQQPVTFADDTANRGLFGTIWDYTVQPVLDFFNGIWDSFWNYAEDLFSKVFPPPVAKPQP